MAGGNFGKALGLRHGRNKLEKGFLQLKHNLKLMLPYANEAMRIPFFQVWHYGWRNQHGYCREYKLKYQSLNDTE